MINSKEYLDNIQDLASQFIFMNEFRLLFQLLYTPKEYFFSFVWGIFIIFTKKITDFILNIKCI